MTTKTIMIVGIKYPPETFIQRKINGLVASGFRVKVWADSQDFKNTDTDNLKVKRIPNTYIERIIYLLMLVMLRPQRFLSLRSICRKNKETLKYTLFHLLILSVFAREKADIVHFEWNIAAISYKYLAEWLNCRMTISCRGSQIHILPLQPQYTHLNEHLKLSFERADAVHCVSQAICKRAMEFGLPSSKASIIRPAVDPEFFYPPRQKEITKSGVLTIVSVGSLIWLKGFEYLLLSMKILEQQNIDFQLFIIGSTKEKQRALYTIHDLNLESSVHLLGKLAPETVREYLQEADMFVLSSLSEGISNAVLEAMACELPIVTTDCGGMREAVSDETEGFVVPTRDPDAMTNAIIRLASNPELRIRMGQAGRKRILTEFTLAKQAKQFEIFYSQDHV